LVIATMMRPQGDTGVQTHARILREGIARAGLPCSVVSPFSGSRKWLAVFAARPLLLHHLNKNWSTRWYRHWHFLALCENLRRHLARQPATAVVASCPLSARAALDVRAGLGMDFKVALVCHFNYSQAEEYRKKGELDDEVSYQKIVELEAQVIQAVDVVIFISHWSRQVVENDRGLRPRSSVMIRNGLSDTPPQTVLSREDLGLEADDLVLINVGTIEPRKNQIGLIDLFAEVCTRYPRARLLLVGDGPQRDEVQRKVKLKGLHETVKFLGYRSDVPTLLQVADIYIHYSSLENCPYALLESARAGLPSAAVPGGGIAELQAQLDSIVVLPAGDIGESLQVLEPLLNDVALRAELGRNARRNFQRHFTREVMTGGYLKVLGLSPEGGAPEAGESP
jgi:glycosyltransferase involved in cell wall biosynthesis